MRAPKITAARRQKNRVSARNLFSFISPAKVFSALVCLSPVGMSMLYFENFNLQF